MSAWKVYLLHSFLLYFFSYYYFIYPSLFLRSSMWYTTSNYDGEVWENKHNYLHDVILFSFFSLLSSIFSLPSSIFVLHLLLTVHWTLSLHKRKRSVTFSSISTCVFLNKIYSLIFERLSFFLLTKGCNKYYWKILFKIEII